MTNLITAKQARLVAASAFSVRSRNGRSSRALSAIKTNRKGAFFYHGTRGSGFIIDGRCLSPDEREAIAAYIKPEIAREWRDPENGQIEAFANPFRQTTRYIQTLLTWKEARFEIFVLEGPAWCLAALFCGIRAERNSGADPFEVFAQTYRPSNHALLDVRSRMAGQGLAYAA